MLAATELEDAAGSVEFNSVFVTRGNGEAVDLKRFERGNPVMEGMHRFDVYVNNNWIGRQDVEVRALPDGVSGSYGFTTSQVSGMGVNPDSLPEGEWEKIDNGAGRLDIRSLIPGATVEANFSELSLNIGIPQVNMNRIARGSVDPSEWDDGINAAFLGYNANSHHSDMGGNRISQQFISFNAGLNLGAWRLRHNGSYSRRSGNRISTESHYESISTYVQRDITSLKSKLTVGEYYTPSELFESVPFTGVQLSSDDQMLPDSMRGFAPVVRGIAETHAKVGIYQGGNLVYETTVPPGAFIIDDLYNTGYAGDLSVTVTEADGRTKSFVVPYAAVTQLLREGISRFSLTAGEYRDDRLRETPRFVQGSYQRGLSNMITVYSGAILAKDYQAVQGGFALSTSFGAIALDVTHSRATRLPETDYNAEQMSGQSYRLTYSNKLNSTNTNIAVAAYRFSSEDYLDFWAFAQLWGLPSDSPRPAFRRRNRLQVSISQPLGEGGGSLYVSGSAQNYWGRRQGSDITYQLGYSNSFRWGGFNLGVSRTRNGNGNHDTQYLVGVNIPLGRSLHSPYLSSTMNYADADNGSVQATVSGSGGEHNQFSYSVYGVARRSDGDSQNSGGASLQYDAAQATLSAGINKGKGYEQANVGVRGSMVIHSGGINLSQYQGETMAIVEAQGAQGAQVSSNSGVKVAGNGYAVVSGLMPYRRNSVELDPKGISDDVELETTRQVVAPRYGSIVKLEYPTVNGTPTLMTLTTADGLSIPMGAEVLDEQKNVVSMVGQGNRVFLRGLEPSGSLYVRWGGGNSQGCRVDYLLPEEKRAGVSFLELSSACKQAL